MWNPWSEAPPDFLAALYGESGEEQVLEEEEEYGEIVDEDMEHDQDWETEYLEMSDEENDRNTCLPVPPPYSPLTSPESKRRRSSETPMSSIVLVEAADSSLDSEFFVPDSHALFESECSTGLVGERGATGDEVGGRSERSVRGRARRGRGGRVRVRGQRRAGGRRRQASNWQCGHPLQEVWLTDDDVPVELREMARDVIKRRRAREEAIQARRGTRVSTRLDEGQNSEGEDDDEFEDAIDGRGPLLEGEDLHFEWSPMETFQGVEETFIPEHTGTVSSYTSPYDAFRSYWDDGILETIVNETNRYASHISSAAFQSEWYPTNADELLCLFAFWMMTGIIRMPTLFSYFSSNFLLKTEVFSRITSLKRYTHLNRALHFVDTTQAANPTTNDTASSDRLYRLKPIIDHLNSKFQANYVLSKDVCIDESLTLWKGRLSFKQYIRSKAAKFGIKTFELCESATGYLWSFLVYTGKQSSFDLGPEIAKSTAVVLKLIEPLLNKGYRLFMDNWFNSPILARFLKRNGTDCVGTLRSSRVNVPKLVTHAPLQQGQLVARHSGDVCVLSWLDKKRITMISTCHGSATGLPNVSSRPPSRPEPFKPQAVLDYNRSMGGVDLKDQMLEPYLLERKRCAKWYVKLFKRLLNASIHNSRILLESSLKARQDNLQFRLELVHTILSLHHSRIPKSRRVESSHRRSLFPQVLHTHWPVRLQQSDTDQTRNRQGRKRCVVCLQEGRKMQKTPFKCDTCDVPLCVENCFKMYHTSRSYHTSSSM